MIQTIGFLELNSIAKGVEAADAMLKAAEVKLIASKPSCPGKYHVLISGEVAAVKASLEAGQYIAGSNVIDKIVIPRVHPQVIDAINLSVQPGDYNAVGVMEFFSVTAAIIAADTAVKAADIKLIEIRLGTGIGGKSFVTMSGDVAAVKAASKAGCAEVEVEGMLVNSVVIPSPRKEIFDNLM